LRNNRHCFVHRAGSGVVLCCVAVLACGCSSTIHKEADIGGTDTLSLDAKQRLLFVGTRVAQTRKGIEPKTVRCAEPSPDALVAVQAVLSASGNATNVGATTDSNGKSSGGGGGSGGLAARSTESAASIGFRDSSIQMLRDSYFRLCEAYMNGVLTDAEYEHMVTNADTYLAVASALQIIGTNPVAPAVAISAGGGSTTTSFRPATTGAADADVDIAAAATTPPAAPSAPKPKAAAKAKPALTDDQIRAQKTREVVESYLAYRYELAHEVEQRLSADRRDEKAGPPIPIRLPPPPQEIYVPR
jgi:hypothetical protein